VIKKISSIGEQGLLRLIKKWTPSTKRVLKGPGDDTAVCRVGRKNSLQLLTMDTMVENVDFKLKTTDPKLIGRKALAINLSDIAAMGGIPRVAVVSLTMKPNTTLQFVKRFHIGLKRIANHYGVAIAGGDLSGGKELSVTIALLGEAAHNRVVYREGAGVGHLIVVTGVLGGSILKHHLTFDPRVKEGQFLSSCGVSSMIDISDGLLQDLGHLIGNKQYSCELDFERIPVSKDAIRLARGNRRRALRHALSDGEDFELLFTVSPKKIHDITKLWKRRFKTKLSVIGRVTKLSMGLNRLAAKKGFQHF
jgi:thiamine-monophosphate kinase